MPPIVGEMVNDLKRAGTTATNLSTHYFVMDENYAALKRSPCLSQHMSRPILI